MMDFAAYKIEREEIATEHKEDMPYMNVSGKRVRQNWANQLAMCTFVSMLPPYIIQNYIEFI